MATKVAEKTAAKRASVKKTTAKTVDQYIAGTPKEQHAALEKLRRTIKAAAPKATEGLSYGMVGYKLNGKYLVYFGSWKTRTSRAKARSSPPLTDRFPMRW